MITNIHSILKNCLKSEHTDGSRYAISIAKFIASKKHDIVVETGSGISSLFFLLEMGGGKLYSVDMKPWQNFRISHPDYVLIENKKSEDALPVLFSEIGPWDIFLHDSDHRIKCMTFELELAMGCVKPGGYIMCDDRDWGNHGAWNKFVKKYDLEVFLIQCISIVQKPIDIAVCENIDKYKDKCLIFAEQEEQRWISEGNQNI